MQCTCMYDLYDVYDKHVINKKFVDSRFRPRCATITTSTCWSVSMSNIWMESRLLYL